MKKSLFVLFILPLFGIAQNCEIPLPFIGNTGSNMTVYLSSDVFDSFPDNLSEDAYLVAMADNSNIVVGSEPVFGVNEAVLVWADDTMTPKLTEPQQMNQLLIILSMGTNCMM